MLIFILKEYLLLFLFTISLLGYGQLVRKKFFYYKNENNIVLKYLIQLGLGFSILILFVQILLFLGFFNIKTVSILMLLGILLTCYFYLSNIFNNKFVKLNCKIRNQFADNKLLFLFFIITIFAIVLKPLRPPIAWDEVAYHLPHAKAWASNGFLSINDNFRYPWFPYNFDILYSIPILFNDDVFPKLIHGLLGFSVGLIGFVLLKNKSIVGILTISVWLLISRGMFEKAYIEFALTFFISFSFVLIYLWITEDNRNYLYLASLFFGVALGIKYQALFYILPLILLTFTNYKKLNISLLIKCFILLIIPCLYWYLRNYLITGNPINPIAGNFFGFYDWNSVDHDFQFNKLESKRDIGNPVLLIFFLFIFFKVKYKNLSNLFYVVSISFIIWFWLSGYWRYLYPMFPLLCFFSSIVFIDFYEKVNLLIQNKGKIKLILKITLCLVLFIYFIDSSFRFVRSSKYIPFDDVKRNEILQKKIRGYDAIKFINDNNLGPTYQFRMEDSIYYFNGKVIGDTFGYGRYVDYFGLPASSLYNKLKAMSVKTLILGEWVDYDQKSFTRSNNFSDYFEMIYESDGHEVYKLN
jgi:hypothetical protein